MSYINSATVQYSQNTEDSIISDLPQGYKLDLKKPVDRYSARQSEAYFDDLKKSRSVTYRGLKKASGRAKRKLERQNANSK